MEEYLTKVREQLCCNATKDYAHNFITFEYSNKQIDDNLDYFKDCKENGMSAYKALTFFDLYLEGDYEF